MEGVQVPSFELLIRKHGTVLTYAIHIYFGNVKLNIKLKNFLQDLEYSKMIFFKLSQCANNKKRNAYGTNIDYK